MSARRVNIVRLTPEWLATRTARLRADLDRWDRLEARYGSRERLVEQIDTYAWLAGGES